MSSSKVIKKTDSFVPEKIVSGTVELESQWSKIIPGAAAAFTTTTIISPDRGEETAPIPDRDTPQEKEATAADSGLVDEPLPADMPGDSPLPPVADTPVEPVIPEPEPPPPEPQIDIDALVEEAYNKGVADGAQRADDDFGSSARALAAGCEKLDSLNETILKNSMQTMEDLVMAIAEKIIRTSVEQQQETIRATVEEAIQQAVKSEEFRIILHPDDMEAIEEKKENLVASLSGLENIILKSDPTVERGGCLIESVNCTVDATLSSQLDIISEELKEKSQL